MKIVTFSSLKGGAGKTTVLMATASMLIDKGLKVACFEADENTPLSVWKSYGTAAGTWDDNCRILPALEADQFASSYEWAVNDGCDIGLVDTKGGGSEVTEAILSSSSLVVVPTGLSVIEVDETLETLKFVVEFYKAQGLDRPYGILLNRVPTSKLSLSEQNSMDILADLPCFESQFPARRIYSELKAIGMLHLYHKALLEIPAKRVAANHTMVALKESQAFVDELTAAMMEEA